MVPVDNADGDDEDGATGGPADPPVDEKLMERKAGRVRAIYHAKLCAAVPLRLAPTQTYSDIGGCRLRNADLSKGACRTN